MTETEMVEVLLAILEVILVTCRKTFFIFGKKHWKNVIKNIVFEILLSKTTPITVRIIYRPTSQTNVFEMLNMIFEKLDINKKEIYILRDFNINMYHSYRYIVHDDNTISSKFQSHDIKNYHQFCTKNWIKTTNTISNSGNL